MVHIDELTLANALEALEESGFKLYTNSSHALEVGRDGMIYQALILETGEWRVSAIERDTNVTQESRVLPEEGEVAKWLLKLL